MTFITAFKLINYATWFVSMSEFSMFQRCLWRHARSSHTKGNVSPSSVEHSLGFDLVNASNILIALGQDHEISTEAAGIFNRCMIPGLLAYTFIQCLNKFRQIQQCFSNAYKLWNHNFGTYCLLLGLCIWIWWIRKQRNRLGNQVVLLG